MPLIPRVGRNRPKVRLLMFTIAAFLWLGVLLHLFPVVWMLSASLKPTTEIFEQPFRLLPAHPTTASYQLISNSVTADALNSSFDVFRYPLSVYLQNSLLIAFATVLMQLPITALA